MFKEETKVNRIKYVLLLLLLVPISLTACHLKSGTNDKEDILRIYFFNMAQNNWHVEDVKVNLEDNAPGESKMYAVVKALAKGPEASSLQGNVPTDLKIKDMKLKDKVAFINFTADYKALSIADQMMIRASLVYSLTELDFITGVEFSIENEPLTKSDGEKVGRLKRENILVSALDPSPQNITQTITLYFTKPNSDKLYAEKREIGVSENVLLEKYVMEELIKGPTEDGLISPLRPGTKLNEVKTQENVSQVDLSYDKAITSPIGEELLVYSIVNSLTELPHIKKVSFLKDGKKQTDVTALIDFNTLFERDESLIATDN